MMMRSFTEGARALSLWVALQIDIAKKHPDAVERARADELVALLTPVIKAAFTDGGSEVANLALQCYGGHGYIKENGVEQFVRDVRVTQLYEGTNGIQALDLVRRKISMDNGAAVRRFFALVERSGENASVISDLMPLAQLLAVALGHLRQATHWMQDQVTENIAEAVSGATDYLRLFGLVALGWVWLDMAKIAHRRLDEGVVDADFYHHKLITARFFLKRQLAETGMLLVRATDGSHDLMELPSEAF